MGYRIPAPIKVRFILVTIKSFLINMKNRGEERILITVSKSSEYGILFSVTEY
jgi:hypothetical protein